MSCLSRIITIMLVLTIIMATAWMVMVIFDGDMTAENVVGLCLLAFVTISGVIIVILRDLEKANGRARH